MAITRLQLPREMYAEGELVAGAAPIKYEGDMRPEAQTASYGFDDAMAESRQAYEDYKKRGIIPPTLTFDEFLEASQEGGFFEMADGGSIRQNYGLGSFVKKIGKGIKKVVDNPFVQSALMLNPATAPYAMTYQGLQGLKQGNPMGALMAYQGMSGPNAPNWMKGVTKYGNSFSDSRGNDQDEEWSDVKKSKNNQSNIRNPFGMIRDALFYKKGTQDIDPLKIALGAGAGLLGVGALQKRANEKQPKLADMIGDRGSKIGLDDIQIKVQAAIDSGDKATYENLKVTENLAFLPPWESIKKADGGRIGYAAGGQTSAEMLQVIEKLRAEGKTELEIQQILKQMFQNNMSFPGQGIPSISQSGPANFIDTVITKTGAGGEMPRTTDVASIRENSQIMQPASAEMSNVKPELRGMMRGAKMNDPRLNQLNRFYQDMVQPQENQRPVPEISPYQAADGGRIGYDMGGISGMMASYGYDDAMSDTYDSFLDMKKNGLIPPTMDFDEFLQEVVPEMSKTKEPKRVMAQEGGLMNLGGMEKDYRNDGGFVPIGGQEKADDVPARLSKNEFVFTADAVRGAGDGDVDEGAELLQDTMKQLEQKGKRHKAAQGMFATAQRLGEVA